MRIVILAALLAVAAAAHSERSLVDLLGDATQGTKLGTAFKVIDAFGKVSKFINDLKNLAPETHKALNSSISDIKDSMSGIISDITNSLLSGGAQKSSRSILDPLVGGSKGSEVATASQVVDPLVEVSNLFSHPKSPETHKTSEDAISDIINKITDFLTHQREQTSHDSHLAHQAHQAHQVHEVSNAFEDQSGSISVAARRSLMDLLGDATQGTKLGTAFKVIDAFGKVSKFINDLKNLAPETHKALNSSISDIKDSMSGIISDITNSLLSGGAQKSTRSLMDLLGDATQGTKLGTAFKVIDAFGKVSKFINDLKNLAPETHKVLNSSISDIKDSMSGIISDITNSLLSGGAQKSTRSLMDLLGDATNGTELGTAFKVIDAFGKVSKFINDLKNLAPETHKALNSSISDIKGSMSGIISDITNSLLSGGSQKSSRDLMDLISGATSGKLGAAFKVIDAIGKVQKLISDVKNLAPEAHQALSSSISDIKNSFNGIISDIVDVIKPQPAARSLMDLLGDATNGTELGTAFKVIDAFGKVSKFINDLKNLAPETHKALNSSISDIKGSMSGIISDVTNSLLSGGSQKSTRSLMDLLGDATNGTELGTAFKVIDAFGKVSKFINDLKNLAPETHKALNSSISDIKGSMSGIISDITNSLLSGGAQKSSRDLMDLISSATSGKLGAAFKVIDAIGKVQKLISDVKNLAPEAHQALSSSISDIKNSFNGIISDIVDVIKPQPATRSLMDLFGDATQGTDLGTAFKVIDAFGKVSKFISDLKNLAPETHKALNSSISDIKDSMSEIISEISAAARKGELNSGDHLDCIK